MRAIIVVAAVSLFIAGCKSSEEKFCERAIAERLYPPDETRAKEKCLEGYRKFDATQRACADGCVKKTNMDICLMSCGAADPPTHNPPPRATPSASSSAR